MEGAPHFAALSNQHKRIYFMPFTWDHRYAIRELMHTTNHPTTCARIREKSTLTQAPIAHIVKSRK